MILTQFPHEVVMKLSGGAGISSEALAARAGGQNSLSGLLTWLLTGFSASLKPGPLPKVVLCCSSWFSPHCGCSKQNEREHNMEATVFL